MNTAPLQTISLRRGQSHGLQVTPGTQLFAVRGSVVVRSTPHWLADTVWRSRLVIQASEAHAFEAGGWVQLEAQGDTAELRCAHAYQSAETRHPSPAHFIRALSAFVRRAFA